MTAAVRRGVLRAVRLSVEKLGSFDNLPAARKAARMLSEAVEAAEAEGE